MTDLFLIDIDGALVESKALELECYFRAVEEVLGITVDIDRSQFKHSTDAGVLDELLTRYQTAGNRMLNHRKVEQRYLALMNEALAITPEKVKVAPGVHDFLANIAPSEDCYLAIATSGWESAARVKLRAVGLDISTFTFATSSDAMSRTEIMALAAFRAKQDSGLTFERCIVLGEGAQNRDASKELGYEYIEIGGSDINQSHLPNLSHFKQVYSELTVH
ncbi:hydrolase, haloacid dehalogenase-like family protein [Photobacterium aquae]|uniref:Hydrolase, haloacid dehalogenase-like family protein n=1 Tax=Photobacterium aquae TaxID=1195763 RepID=A0A0J1H080_9GAMM|nr:HAD hydrolase-like protein [Photobacterium aquae]KLV05214.1 hydrolase, haloacid dehalogenase-like family protein [Photobacterium aquae]